MASPFRYFRKHSKTFMATAAVLAIFLFVFASGLGGSSSSDDRRVPAATVATWNYGSINEGQLASLAYQRLITNEFLIKLFQQGGGRTFYELPRDLISLIFAPSTPKDAVDETVINTEVLASLAEEAGMTVSDDMINHCLDEFGLRRVSGEEMTGILATVGRQSVRTNEAVVFNTLRRMLLAHFYARSFEDASAVVLPEQRWDDWRKVNERISLEVAVLPVEKFLEEAPEPTDSQLQALFNDYKDRAPNLVANVGGRVLPLPTPGFSDPQRVKFYYLAGSVAEKTQQLLDAVTEDEIVDYYERNKRLEFIKTDFALEDDDGADPSEYDAADSESSAVAEPPDADGVQPPGAEPPESGTEEPVTDQDASTDDASENAAELPDQPEPTTDASEAPAQESGDEIDSPAEGPETSDEGDPATEAVGSLSHPRTPTGDSSMAPARKSRFQLASFQLESQTSEESAEGEAESPASDSHAGGADAGDGEPADAGPSSAAESGEAEPADSDSQATRENGAQDNEAAADSADESRDNAVRPDADGSQEGEQPPPVQYEPLDKVRDEIRETLARDKAFEQLQRIMGEAAAKLQAEYNRFGRKVAEARGLERPMPAAPAKLRNLDWLAQEYGLTGHETALLTDQEVLELPMGRAYDDQTGRLSVTQALFASLELFEPFLARDLSDWYLVVKTEDQPKRTPSFEAARKSVEAAWKHMEAAKLAEKKAQELAKELETATTSFQEFFASKGFDAIPQTELFSWRRYAGGPGMGYAPGLGDVPELKNIGPDFMEAAFALEEDKARGLLNFDHSVAYVIRLHSRQYTPEQLRQYFLEEEEQWEGRADMRSEHQSAFRQVVMRRLLEDVAGFHFDEDWERRRLEALAESNN